jgi:long-chain acyl-CoA synthetase
MKTKKEQIIKIALHGFIVLFTINLPRGSSLNQVWVYGNSFESFLVAVVVPEKQAIEDWAALNGMSGDYAEFCNDPKARRYIQDELNKTGKKLGVRHQYAAMFCTQFLIIKTELVIPRTSSIL